MKWYLIEVLIFIYLRTKDVKYLFFEEMSIQIIFLVIAVLVYNSNTIQFTHLKCIVQWGFYTFVFLKVISGSSY